MLRSSWTLGAVACLVLTVGCRLLSTAGGGPGGPAPLPEPSPCAGNTPMILAATSDPRAVAAQHAALGVDRIYEMHTQHIDPQGSKRWTARAQTDKWLDRNVPRSHSGFICLDWEGPAFAVLKAGPGHPDHQALLGDMIKLVKHVKTRRPGSKVGYYGLPMHEYWKQDARWESSMRALAPLFAACDVLFPSVYDFYPDDTSLKRDRDRDRFGNIVRLALELARGKPVLLYTMHRYHISTPAGGSLIPDDEYLGHVAYLMSIEVGGRRPVGVVAWDADEHYFQQAFARSPDGSYKQKGVDWDRRRAAFTAEKPRGESVEAWRARTRSRVYANLRRALSGS